jgi:hypothetical protein
MLVLGNEHVPQSRFRKVIVDIVEGLVCIGKMNTSILIRSYERP